MTKDKIYRRELERALDLGFSGAEAERMAKWSAEKIYYEMADEADQAGPHNR